MQDPHIQEERPRASGLLPILGVAAALSVLLAGLRLVDHRSGSAVALLPAATLLALAAFWLWYAIRISVRAGTGQATLWSLVPLGFAALLLAHFHDRFWWPPDDGAYGYVAQRILAGDVVNGNLQELHPGYISFLHAATLVVFGEDLVSLRYPLVAVTLLQAAIGYWLLMPRGPLVAVTGTALLAAISLIQFLDPSPNWYALAMAFAVVAVLAQGRSGDPRREALLGAMIAATFLLRQLSGVALAMGVATWLLCEASDRPATRPRLARTLLAIMAAGVVAYFARNKSVDGALLFGLWPLALLVIGIGRTQMEDRAVLRMVLWMAIGAVLACLPIGLYHLHHGTLDTLYEDTVLATLHLTQLDYQHLRRYWIIAYFALRNLFEGAGVAAGLSAIFWLALLAAPPALGLRLALAGRRDRAAPFRHPLPVIAVFFAIICTPFEIPIYLTYASGITAVALFWLEARAGWRRAGLAAAAILLATIGIALHAGQPLSRNLDGIVAGRRVPLDATAMLPRVSLHIEQRDHDIYSRVLALIERHVPPGQPFLALPANPELYFMSNRPAPYRFHISATGIRDEDALAAAVAVLEATPPPIVIHDPADKFNNWASAGLLAHVKARYVLTERIGPFDIYLPAGGR